MMKRRVETVGPLQVQRKHVCQLSKSKFGVGPEQHVRTEERTNLRLHSEQKQLGAEANSDASTSMPTASFALNLVCYVTHLGRGRGGLGSFSAVRSGAGGLDYSDVF